LILQRFLLTPEELKAWGWRIPFYIGGGLAIFTAVMQRHLHETEHFVAAKQAADRLGQKIGGLRQLLKYPKEIAIVVGLTMGGTTAFYTYTTYMQNYLKLSVGLSDAQTTMVTACSLIFALCLQPTYGALSDRIGRRPLLIFFGVAGTLFTIPILTTLQTAKGPWQAFFLIAAAWIIVSGYTSINAVVKAELFPTAVRAIGVGLPYALTVSIFGGSAESLALYFKTIGHETWFYYYLTAIIAASLCVYALMRDTGKASTLNRQEK
jgi:MHS family alpha-ketoglutarate permease-like MFS transporter